MDVGSEMATSAPRWDKLPFMDGTPEPRRFDPQPGAPHEGTLEVPQPPSPRQRSVMIQGKFEYSSPYPPPNVIEALERCEKGAAGRILAMVEREQVHEHDMDKIDIKEYYALGKTETQDIFRLGRSGQLALLAIVFMFCATSVTFAALKYPWFGIAAFGATLAAVMLAVVWGKRMNITFGRDGLRMGEPPSDEPPTSD